ncbi:MAG TPA: hypothetical protein VN622_05275 [Clostridia bacterium]|nr:hypothetical protein [Clostridia bacterium]
MASGTTSSSAPGKNGQTARNIGKWSARMNSGVHMKTNNEIVGIIIEHGAGSLSTAHGGNEAAITAIAFLPAISIATMAAITGSAYTVSHS